MLRFSFSSLEKKAVFCYNKNTKEGLRQQKYAAKSLFSCVFGNVKKSLKFHIPHDIILLPKQMGEFSPISAEECANFGPARFPGRAFVQYKGKESSYAE